MEQQVSWKPGHIINNPRLKSSVVHVRHTIDRVVADPAPLDHLDHHSAHPRQKSRRAFNQVSTAPPRDKESSTCRSLGSFSMTCNSDAGNSKPSVGLPETG